MKVGNLAAPVAEWTVGGTPLTSLMDVERRHGNNIIINNILYYENFIILNIIFILKLFGVNNITPSMSLFINSIFCVLDCGWK